MELLGKCFDLFQPELQEKKNVKTIICDLSPMPGTTTCTLTKGFRREQI